MTNEDKVKLITRNLEEILTEEELTALIESNTPLKHYIGFEISGKLHIGYLFTLLKVKDLQDAGAETTLWLADLHSAINDKLDGNLETIKKVARGYFTSAMRVLFESIGGDPDKLIFKLCSETYSENPDFWLTLLEIAKTTSLARTKRSITIMGREESDDNMPTDKLFYPIMQAADIFLLQANIAHAGIDQRKVHVVAREAAMQVKVHPLKDATGKQIKPVTIHHPILLSLAGSVSEELNKYSNAASSEIDEIAMRSKMSKSKADSGISIHDSPEEIRRKINNAFAPEGTTLFNPILNWTKYLVFYTNGSKITINRKPEHGGDIQYDSYDQLEQDYKEEKLHPMDLKNAIADWLIGKLEPVRIFFEQGENKNSLEELESLVK